MLLIRDQRNGKLMLVAEGFLGLDGSAETPSTAVPLSAKAPLSRVKSMASLVQPGVSARG